MGGCERTSGPGNCGNGGGAAAFGLGDGGYCERDKVSRGKGRLSPADTGGLGADDGGYMSSDRAD